MRALPPLLLVLLAGCATPEGTMVGGQFYAGPVLKTRLADLALRTEEGRVLGFPEMFAGYAPDPGLGARRLPLDKIAINRITDARVEAAAIRYDANGNGWLEEPELLVLYVREAARGTGRPVAQVGAAEPVGALAVPAADTGGLMRWVEAHKPAMDPDTAWLFTGIEWIGRDQMLESEGRDRLRHRPY